MGNQVSIKSKRNVNDENETESENDNDNNNDKKLLLNKDLFCLCFRRKKQTNTKNVMMNEFVNKLDETNFEQNSNKLFSKYNNYSFAYAKALECKEQYNYTEMEYYVNLAILHNENMFKSIALVIETSFKNTNYDAINRYAITDFKCDILVTMMDF